MDYGRNGYIGTWICGEDGTFVNSPTVTLDFSQSHPDTVPGLTILWSSTYNEWATRFKVTAYHGGRSVFYKEITDNTEVQSVVSGNLSGFDQIVLEILAWSKPFCRARIEDFFIGIEKTYTKTDIISYSCTMFVDPLSASLPKSEINFTLINLNGEYNLDNTLSTHKYLMERQEVHVRYGYKLSDDKDIEWITGGNYYLSGWGTPQNGITIDFTARDAFEFMDDTFDPSNLSSDPTLYEVVSQAFEQANLPLMEDGSNRWYVSNHLDSIQLPSEAKIDSTSIAQVIQCCANAACCVVYQDRTGRIHVEKLVMGLADYLIDQFNSYANAEVTLSKELKEINVNNGKYVLPVGYKTESQSISNDFIDDSQAPTVAAWAADFLQNRRIYSGSYRADPRLDPLDLVQNKNNYATNSVLITEVGYTYNGAFRGSFKGRGIDNAMASYLHAGEPLARAGIQFPDLGGVI